MAVMYSKLGGCFEETTKLGSLAKTDLCAFVKGLLDRLMTHFGLDSSIEEESRVMLCLWGGETFGSWGLALLVTWETLAWEETNWETSLSACETALSAKGALPAWELLLQLLPAWEFAWELLLWEALPWETLLSGWEIALSAWEAFKALSLAEPLTAGAAWELPAQETSLSAWERVLPAGEAWLLAAWEDVPAPRVDCLPACLWTTYHLGRSPIGWSYLSTCYLGRRTNNCLRRGPSGQGNLSACLTPGEKPQQLG